MPTQIFLHKGAVMKKKLFMGLVLSLFIAGSYGSSSYAGESKEKNSNDSEEEAKAPQNQRTIVPGGLNQQKLTKLWKVAKTQCYDLRYTVANEDKETGNLVCVLATDAGQDMMIVNFDDKSFLVTVKGNMQGIPIMGSMVMRALNKHKKQMDDALKAAAGISK
jgi:hypothetical protein